VSASRHVHESAERFNRHAAYRRSGIGRSFVRDRVIATTPRVEDAADRIGYDRRGVEGRPTVCTNKTIHESGRSRCRRRRRSRRHGGG